ncbi:hypothetical protein HPHPP26_1575 [Helicobacter pylori Hp P-26]|nr:hypothetical protein HPHPP26_1575 [Helicobacter pylori Hp P-26]
MGEAFLSFSNFTFLHILATNSNERSFFKRLQFYLFTHSSHKF